jgi:hypothetical protein
MTIERTFIMLQIFLFIGMDLNAYLAGRNIANESYLLATASTLSALMCLVCFIVNWRRMVHFRRAEREDLRLIEALARATHLSVLLARNPQRELNYCYEKCICPDCTNYTLHQATMRCMHPQCGSRFQRDANGTWSRPG